MISYVKPFVLFTIIILLTFPVLTIADDAHWNKQSRIAGNVYAGTLSSECSTGVDFTESNFLTFNSDSTYSIESQGVQRRVSVQISPGGVETSELVEYSIQCSSIPFTIERFKKAFLIKNTEQTQCSGKYLSSAGNVTAGDSFTFSQQPGTQVYICDSRLRNCQYSDSTLAEEFQTIDIVKLGGHFEFLASCRRIASYILIDKKRGAHKSW